MFFTTASSGWPRIFVPPTDWGYRHAPICLAGQLLSAYYAVFKMLFFSKLLSIHAAFLFKLEQVDGYMTFCFAETK